MLCCIIWLGTRQQLAKLDLAAMAVSFSSHLLFETWDSHWISRLLLLLTLTAYAATATTNCVSYVSSLALLLPLLLLLLSHAFLTSRLDYCSTLCVGLPDVRLSCIERVIRTAARLIGCIPI